MLRNYSFTLSTEWDAITRVGERAVRQLIAGRKLCLSRFHINSCLDALAQGGEQSVIKAAIASHIRTARNEVETARKADACLLNMILTTGDGNPLGGQIGVCFQKCLFDNGGWQGNGTVQLAKHLWAVDACVSLSGKGEIIRRVQSAARAVFLPLMPCQTASSHDIGHGPGLSAAGRAPTALTVRRIAARELRPKPMQSPAVVLIRIALRGLARIAGQFAPIW